MKLVIEPGVAAAAIAVLPLVTPKQAEFGNQFCRDVSSGPCHSTLLSLETMEINSDLI